LNNARHGSKISKQIEVKLEKRAYRCANSEQLEKNLKMNICQNR